MSKPKDIYEESDFEGLKPHGNYVLVEGKKAGKVGAVFKAVNQANSNDYVACKIILHSKLKFGWLEELNKIGACRTCNRVQFKLSLSS